MIKFGPAGNSDSFYKEGFKSSIDMPKWLKKMGLNAYEYQASRGIKVKEETARQIGENALDNNIHVSIHGPYYINLVTDDTTKKEKTKGYFYSSLKLADYLGAKKIVFHPGSASRMTREKALQKAKTLLWEIIEKAPNWPNGVMICPETMGKQNQLGTLDEVVELSKLAPDRIQPAVDFGHINALEQGSLKKREDFLRVFSRIEKGLGYNSIYNLHCHFSRIEFSKGGEKKHWTFADTEYGPDFEPLAEAIIEYKLNPTLICESQGTMAEDAITMMEIYARLNNS
jgi:deoxyribonuclease-4